MNNPVQRGCAAMHVHGCPVLEPVLGQVLGLVLVLELALGLELVSMAMSMTARRSQRFYSVAPSVPRVTLPNKSASTFVVMRERCIVCSYRPAATRMQL